MLRLLPAAGMYRGSFLPDGRWGGKPEGVSAVHSGRVRKRSRFLYLMINQESRKFFAFYLVFI